MRIRSLSLKIYLIVLITLALGGCQINQKISSLKQDLLKTNEMVKENTQKKEIKELKEEEEKNNDVNFETVVSDDPEKGSKDGRSDFLELNKPRKEESQITTFFSKLFGPEELPKGNSQPENLRESELNLQVKDKEEKSEEISGHLRVETEVEDETKKSDTNFKTLKADNSEKLEEDNFGFLELNKPRKEESQITTFFSKIFGPKEDPTKVGIKPENFEESIPNIEKKENINATTVNETKSKKTFKPRLEPKLDIKDLEPVVDLDEDRSNKEIGQSENTQNLKNEKTVFFQLKKPLQKTRKERITKKNNLVGLLVPLTGSKKSAGELVVNTLRYNILKNPTDLIFRIYDTKGTPAGAIKGAQKAIDEDVNVFIGPIFSDETKQIRDAFKSRSTIFFSLSTDTSNNSENVIITGQSPENQITCITQDIIFQEKKNVLLIFHDGKYGEIVKKSLFDNIKEKNYFDLIQIEFFEILENDNLNEKIKVLSNFQNRKNQLENKIKSIKKDKNLSAQEKRFELKKLDKRLTLGDLPFDAIIIASEGNKLLEILSHLAFYDINTKNTLIYGTGLWENTEKKETVYENSFFATDIKSPSTEFVQDYKINFSKSPPTAIFHLADLIEFVKDFKRSELSYPEGKIYNGKFSNSVLKDGLFLREVYIKKINKNSLNNITSCSTDVL